MHVRPFAALIATTAVLAAGCGQAAGGGGSSLQSPPPSQPGKVTISGVLLATTSAHPKGGSPQSGIKIGFYKRPISNEGPLMADPPDPIATSRTASDGTFTIELPAGHRYFVSAIDAHGYAPGRWAKLGAPVHLVACTDCAIPL